MQREICKIYESDDEDSITDPDEWLKAQIEEIRRQMDPMNDRVHRQPRRRQRDILAVNIFDRTPIEERLDIPYEVAFRLVCDHSDPAVAKNRIEEMLQVMSLNKLTVQPLINQSLALFDKPQFSKRGTGYLIGTVGQIPRLFVAMLEQIITATQKTQVQLEVMNILELFNPNETIRFLDGWMDCTSFGLGSMPSNSLFFERMAYRTCENSASNIELMHNTLMSINNVAGGRVLSSWMEFSYSKRMLHLTFAVPIDPDKNEGLQYDGYRLTLPFNSIREIVAAFHATEDENRLLIRFKSPPQLWKALPKHFNGKMSLNLTACRDWSRALHYETIEGMNLTQEILGRSCVLSIGLPRSQAYPSDVEPHEVFHREDENNFMKNGCLARFFNLLGRLQVSIKCPLYFSTVRFVHLGSELRPIECPDYSSRRLNYALHGLMERGFVVLDQLENGLQFFERVRSALSDNQEACEEAMEDLLSIFDERRLTTLLHSFNCLFNQKTSTSTIAFARFNDLPKNSVLVKKVIITPNRRLFFPPQVMMSNRVVRHFGQEYALRCTFRDDNGQRLSTRNFIRGHFPGNSKYTRDACEIVNQTIRRALLEPIEIGGLKFRFLAWSNSQLRDHGCYMYADHTNYDNELINVDTIRDWMGDFSAAKSIPKLMSRMGQCFTQAYPTISLRPRDWRLIPDFESDYVDPSNGKNYVFSDGVGRISERMATRIAAIMDLEIVPSCFQIRFKGFKGILVQWPNLLANRFYPDVVFRESQKKFDDSDDETKEILEVVKYSMPSAVCLNRPMIMILDQVSAHQNSKLHLKVTNRITEIFERELDGLGAMLTNDKMAAIQLTTRTTSSIGFQQLAQAGIRLTDEPFFRQLLYAIYRYCICQDIIKLKIPLPASSGRTMYGVIDELGYLNPGQVFFQYSPNLCNPSDVCRSFIGPVLISKNPCHVPGDVRLFDAVYVPELSHLRDVVVFPRFAARPHTDEMSGSDLDGDEYTVIFDSDLFIEHNEPPMNFPKAAVVEEEEQVDAPTGIVDFFLKYLDQDAIGRVSNAHLIAADKCGIYDPICERIAAKCSIAVDFPKTGQPADPLDEAERFHETPDFMGANRATYQSQRLLGKLFRKARVLEEILEVVSSESEIESKSDQFLLDEQFELDEPEMFKTAVEIRDFYYAKLQQVLDEYGIESEAEMLSGHALSIRRITEMEKSDYSFYHADRIVEMRWSKIRETFRSEFFEEFGGESMIFQSTPSGAVFIGPERSLVKARCWYSVAYGKHAENKSIQFRSFPWLIWDVLLVARRKQIIRALQLNKTITPTLSVLYPHLNEYVRKFCLTYNDEVKAFVFNLRSLGSFVECFDRYVSVYGNGLLNIIFILDFWLQEAGRKNDIYSKCQFDRHHLIAAVLQFGLGIRSSTNQFVKGDYLLPIQVDSLEEANRLEKKYELRETGRFLLEFARFFGSSQISLAQRLDLSFGISPTDRSLVMENVVDWMLVSELSYKTFHHISLCRNFDAFVNKFETLLAS